MANNSPSPVHLIRPGVIPGITAAPAILADATAQHQLAWIKAHCQVTYYPPSPCLPVPVQPITHYQPTGRDHWDQLMAIANNPNAAPT